MLRKQPLSGQSRDGCGGLSLHSRTGGSFHSSRHNDDLIIVFVKVINICYGVYLQKVVTLYIPSIGFSLVDFLIRYY